MRSHRTKMRGVQGFTLIELLVAIGLMALMTTLSWRGLDGMTRAQTRMHQQSDDLLALQSGLAQWGADLDGLALQPNTPNLDWDGRALRLLRRSTGTPGEGLRVVAWARHDVDGRGQWLRWQSPPLTTRGELEQAWQKAALWGQQPRDEDRPRVVRLVPLDQWEIFYYRGDAWSNPLSSAGAAASTQATDKTPPTTAPPDGIRLVLHLPAGQALSGTLTRDWLRPTLGGGK